MSKTVVKNKKTLGEKYKDIACGVTSFFIFWFLAVFPLYTHDKYFDILGARYVFFKISTVILALILSILGISYLISDHGESTGGKRALVRFIEAFRIENLKKYIKASDVFFLLMIISTALSTIGSDKLIESFYGNAGRYQGFECWIIYIVLYICISRTYRFKKWHLDIALIAGVLVSLWAITDFFCLNILGFLDNVDAGQRGMFSSSIGNLNTLTNYTAIVSSIGIICFILEEKPIKSIFYAICAIICMAGNVFGLSDNAVLSVLIIYMIVPFLVVKNRRQFVRFTISITFLTLVLGYLYWAMHCGHEINWMDSFFKQLVNASIFIRFSFIFTIIINIITYILCIKIKSNNMIEDKGKILDAPMSKIFHKIWLGLIIASVVLVVFIVIDYNFTHHFDAIWAQIPSNHQFKLGDDWGTHRGHNWRIGFTNFSVFNIFHKIFGYGPDTYLVVTEKSFYDEMVHRYGEVYDSAHNEYINYLVCEGILGLVSYLGISISSIIYGLRASKNNIWAMALVLAVISYMFQAVVNIAIPITTPVFFTAMFMMVGMYINDEENRL